MKLIIVFFLMVITPVAFSQNEWWKSGSDKKKEQNKKEDTQEIKDVQPIMKDSVFYHSEKPKVIEPGKIQVVKSTSVDKIIKFKSATIPPNMGPVMNGYRIQLFFDQSRSQVDNARSTALQMDSETSTYIEYKAPNYLLLLGDFRTQLEAEKMRAKLTSEFPEAIVVEDKINLPKIKEIEKNEETD